MVKRKKERKEDGRKERKRERKKETVVTRENIVSYSVWLSTIHSGSYTSYRQDINLFCYLFIMVTTSVI
jgi:hypothetical protein